MTIFRRVGAFPSEPSDQKLWASRLQDELAYSFQRTNLGFDVRDYGARGDGVTDDTAAIQRTINAAHAAGGGTVYLPISKCIISRTLTLYSFVTLMGRAAPDYLETGKGSIIQVTQATLAGVPMIDVSGTYWAGVQNLKLLVAGQDPTANTTLAIADLSSDASFLKITRNHFRWFGGAVIKLQGAVNWISENRGNNQNSHFIWINGQTGHGSDNFIMFNDSGAHQTNGANGSNALYIDGGSHNTIIGNELYNHQFGIRVNGSGWNRIEGNRTEKNGNSGISLGSSEGNVVLGNVCFNNGYNTGKRGIVLDTNSIRNQIIANRIFNDSTIPGGTNQLFGIELGSGCNYNLVKGNHLYDLQQSAITLDTATNNVVEGNYIYNTQQYGIIAQNSCNDTVICGNMLVFVGLAANNTYDGIVVSTSCNDCVIENNTVRTSGAAQTRYAINVNTANCNRTRILLNDIRGGWATAPGLRDAGTTTIYVSVTDANGALGISTELQVPSIDSGANVDLVLQRNNVTKLTIGNALDTHVNDVLVGATTGGTAHLIVGGSDATTLALYRALNTGGAAAGQIEHVAQDSANAIVSYAMTTPKIDVNTAGAHEGRYEWAVADAGTLAVKLGLTKAALRPNSASGLTLGTSALPWSEVFTPSVDSGSATDLVLQRNNVTKITAGNASTTLADTLLVANGDAKLQTVGNGLYIKEGTNATLGISAAMVLGTTTVNTTKVTANSRIFLTVEAPGGTLGSVYISARTAGTSFTITSTSATDTSTVGWLIVEPA